MSVRDQDGIELLEPSYPREKLAPQNIWAVYEVQRGFHDVRRVSDYVTLYLAREEAQRRNETRQDPDYDFKVYRPHRLPQRQMPQKRNTGKR
jgi:hypothetical protein